MIVGFTGVIWEARPAERLAHDLHHGEGPARLAESGLAWARIGAELADIGVEYAKILADLGMHWQSHSYNHAFDKLTQLAPWFADAAAQAGHTAAKAETQAVATTVALTAMPNPLELQAAKAIQEALQNASKTAGGGALHAAAATAEHAQQDQKQRASRVMESYEKATTPVAHPWKQPSPPKIVSGAALAAEEAAREAAEKAKASMGSGIQAGLAMAPAIGGGFRGGGGDIERKKSEYAVTEMPDVAEAIPVNATTGPATVGPAAHSGMPMGPMGAAGAQGGRDEDHYGRSYDVTPVASTASASDVNLPAGWVQTGETDSAVSWSDVAGRYEPSAPLAEGQLDLGGGTVPPAVLGAPDEGGDL